MRKTGGSGPLTFPEWLQRIARQLPSREKNIARMPGGFARPAKLDTRAHSGTRTSASPSPSFSLGETSTTPASVMAPLSLALHTQSPAGRRQFPRWRCHGGWEMCPRTNSKHPRRQPSRDFFTREYAGNLHVNRNISQPSHKKYSLSSAWRPKATSRSFGIHIAAKRTASVMTSLSRLPASPPVIPKDGDRRDVACAPRSRLSSYFWHREICAHGE